MVGLNTNRPARERVLRLMEEKDRIEARIREETSVLESNNIGMTEPLVDDQGFPRSDIDVYKVRHARHQIICLQNDHKAIMRRIENGLIEVHAQLRPSQGATSIVTNGHLYGNTNGHANGHANGNGAGLMDVDIPPFVEQDNGFALVTMVHHGSPADTAGLRVNDEILQFGSVTTQNFNDITQVNDIVAHSIGQNIRVIVKRDRFNILNLTVTPRVWEQPGLLGCQIIRRS